MDRTRLESLTHEVVGIASETAEFIRKHVGQVTSSQIESKEKNSLVSFVDKGAERILVEKLSPLVPNPGFITEEDTVSNNRSEYTWIVDPLDGTTNFLQGIPIFSVSIALVHHTEVIMGCVADIMQDDIYYAWLDGGSWLGDNRLEVSETPKMSEAIVATGFPYFRPEALNGLATMFQEVLLATRGIRRLGSAALDMTYVAAGKMDGFYETDLNAWDVAAGTLLVREAGGTVTDFQGNGDFVTKRQIIATNGQLHSELSGIVVKHHL